MKEKILTDNAGERISIKWDGERFALVHSYFRYSSGFDGSDIILLNPKEMLELIEFAGSLGEEHA